MQFALLILVACLVPLAGRSQTRTWTFIQDGKMVNDSGAIWSFKKNGRMDAAFVRADGTNVVLLVPDATCRTLPLLSLSPADRSYVRRVGGVTDQEAEIMAQTVSAQSAASSRVIEATRLKNEAFARRRLAQLALDAADSLENDAGVLLGRAGVLATQANCHDSVADTLQTSRALTPRANEVAVNARADAALKKSDADNLMQDAVRIRNQAAEKRACAARLKKEADDLEQTSRSLQPSQSEPAPAFQ
jgi:hypothetical protein